MAKRTLKILWCEHRKVFKVCSAIFQHSERKANGNIGTKWINLFNCFRTLEVEYPRNSVKISPKVLWNTLLTKAGQSFLKLLLPNVSLKLCWTLIMLKLDNNTNLCKHGHHVRKHGSKVENNHFPESLSISAYWKCSHKLISTVFIRVV